MTTSIEQSTKKVVQPNKQSLLNRLKRIEGQVRGIQKMVAEDRYCVDILNQMAAVQAALNQVSLSLLEDHSQHCVNKAILQNDGEAAITELMDVVKRLIK